MKLIKIIIFCILTVIVIAMSQKAKDVVDFFNKSVEIRQKLIDGLRGE